MTEINDLKAGLRKFAKPNQGKLLERYFKTGPGEYAEGDRFLGLKTAETVSVANSYADLSYPDLAVLLASRIHEERTVATSILVRRFEKGDLKTKKEVYDFYLKNLTGINNWDLVDISAPRIVGGYLWETKGNCKFLYEYAKSDNLWKRRVAVMATFYFIKESNFAESLKIAQVLLADKEDLIHKAVGWMLREIGKKDKAEEVKFLKKNYRVMPRTMLRYAIEKFPERERQQYLKSKI